MKPLGFFELDTPETTPLASFSYLPDWHTSEHYARLALHSARTGHRWVLCLCTSDVLTEDTVRASIARVWAVAPWIVGVTWSEEHYEAALASIPWQDDAQILAAVDRVLEASERSHAAIQAVTGWPIVWITTVVNADPRFGAWWYRPVPAGVAVVALDAYVPTGSTFAIAAEPIIRHAVETSPLPIALIWQAFEADGWAPLTAETIAGYGQWAQHPKVIANWLFTWDSRPVSRIRGLADLPQWHGAVLEALR